VKGTDILMQYCEHCKVQIRGNRKYCPLCQNPLTGSGSREEEVFPVIPESYQYNLILRLLIFIKFVICYYDYNKSGGYTYCLINTACTAN
jgi:hypothetical protein